MSAEVAAAYIQPRKKDLAVVLSADVSHWWEQFRVKQSSTQGQTCVLMQNIPVESASWRKQETVADRQLKQTFNKLAKKWRKETAHLSFIEQMVSHPCYHEIIAMGSKVIPLILKELKREPDFWFSALRALSGENPVTKDMRGDVMAMRKAWLDWGSEHGYF